MNLGTCIGCSFSFYQTTKLVTGENRSSFFTLLLCLVFSEFFIVLSKLKPFTTKNTRPFYRCTILIPHLLSSFFSFWSIVQTWLLISLFDILVRVFEFSIWLPLGQVEIRRGQRCFFFISLHHHQQHHNIINNIIIIWGKAKQKLGSVFVQETISEGKPVVVLRFISLLFGYLWDLSFLLSLF